MPMEDQVNIRRKFLHEQNGPQIHDVTSRTRDREVGCFVGRHVTPRKCLAAAKEE